MRAYGAYLVPTFLVFDGAGNLLFRQSGAFPDVGTIKARVRGIEGSNEALGDNPRAGANPARNVSPIRPTALVWSAAYRR